MPTYSYECTQCHHVEDKFHPMTATLRVKCEECGARCVRLIGKGAGIIFKGSGFYETDFKEKKGTPPSKTAKTDAAGGNGKGESKSESKSEPKSEPKSKSESKSDKKPVEKASDTKKRS